VATALETGRISGVCSREQAVEALSRVSLEAKAHLRPDDLSGERNIW
jgi:ABC-type polar amino acid transport system ATPase subunit